MRSKAVVLFFLFLLPAVYGSAGSGKVSIKGMPDSLDGFLSIRSKISRTPQGGAAVFVIAAALYVRNRELGKKALTIALDRSVLSKGGRSWYKGFRPSRSLMYHINRLHRMPFLPGIYVQGTSSAGGYRIPDGIIHIRWKGWKRNRSGDRKKIFLYTTSGNMPRPLVLVKNNRGIWKVKYLSSFFVGPVRMPARKKVDDDL